MQKYAFLDRDGTFLWEPERPAGIDPRETFPLKSMDEFRFMDGAIEGMKTLAAKGYELVMVTNQTFLGTPKHPRDMFDQVMKRIDEELAKESVRFSLIVVCPHGPDEGCDCRKPAVGGTLRLLEGRDVDWAHSLMFGDRDTDRQFAENLGIRFVSIETNKRFVLPEGV